MLWDLDMIYESQGLFAISSHPMMTLVTWMYQRYMAPQSILCWEPILYLYNSSLAQVFLGLKRRKEVLSCIYSHSWYVVEVHSYSLWEHNKKGSKFGHGKMGTYTLLHMILDSLSLEVDNLPPIHYKQYKFFGGI